MGILRDADDAAACVGTILEDDKLEDPEEELEGTRDVIIELDEPDEDALPVVKELGGAGDVAEELGGLVDAVEELEGDDE